jgi:hypothetical protein
MTELIELITNTADIYWNSPRNCLGQLAKMRSRTAHTDIIIIIIIIIILIIFHQSKNRLQT